MQKLEVFFDYACPYCWRSYQDLEALMPEYPALAVSWHPCEAHPRPDRYGPHSDLCIRAMYFAQDAGVDLWQFHRRMYELIHRERVEIEDAEALANALAPLLDSAALLEALRQGRHQVELDSSNHFAYRESGVWVVPVYRIGERRIDAIEDVGISRRQLAEFLQGGIA